jgi:thiosulfate/3-mercaptopyruvate sulfurtransferase
MSGPLIQPSELSERLESGLTVLDVRWDLGGPRYEDYLGGHVPGAAFVDLDRALSEPPGAGGRHPLPGGERFARAMRRAGVRSAAPVVVYDAATSMAAARAWWLLRYYGHADVRVLDGGLVAWIAGGHPLQTGLTPVEPGDFVAVPGGMPLLDAGGAAELASRGVLLDARSAERFRGEREPLDPVAGHIPGARNRPATENLDPGGRFLSAPELREAFEHLGVREEVPVGAYCGSGVTASHEVLALELAGFPAALYAGSWSEWITDPARPVATGE